MTTPDLAVFSADGELRAMRAVYSFAWPEIRSLAQMTLPDDAFRQTTPADELTAQLADAGLDITVPPTACGHADLDALSGPLTDRLVTSFASHAPGLDQFAWRYPTQGSSPGIFHLLAGLATNGVTEIHVLDGEYEGYGAYASHLGIHTVTHPVGDLADPPAGDGWWFVSDPSAVDGGPLPDRWAHRLGDAGWKVVADLAYLGAGTGRSVDVDHPNVAAVVMSLSKPWGMFRMRVGATVTRSETPSLYATRWFHDPARLAAGVRAVEAYPPFELAVRYRHFQHRAVEALRNHGIPAEPADVVLLATVPGDAELDAAVRRRLEPFRRGAGYRLCLTPYFEDLEQRVPR